MDCAQGWGEEVRVPGAEHRAVPSNDPTRSPHPCEVTQGYDIIRPASSSPQAPLPGVACSHSAPNATLVPYPLPHPEKKHQSSAKLTSLLFHKLPPTLREGGLEGTKDEGTRGIQLGRGWR